MIAAATHQGYGRPTNQDVALAEPLDDATALLAVADGVGGYPGGETAARLAVDALHDVLARAPRDDPAAALAEAFEAADGAVRAEQRGAYADMCTVLVAAIVRRTEGGAEAWLGNVGDCRGYAVAGGVLRPLTRDHSWVEEQIRAGRLTPDDPLARSARNVITRSIGGAGATPPDTFGPERLQPGDILLLCSDGLHGPVPPDAILEALAAPPDADTAAARLVHAALARGGPDNIGVALFLA